MNQTKGFDKKMFEDKSEDRQQINKQATVRIDMITNIINRIEFRYQTKQWAMSSPPTAFLYP